MSVHVHKLESSKSFLLQAMVFLFKLIEFTIEYTCTYAINQTYLKVTSSHLNNPQAGKKESKVELMKSTELDKETGQLDRYSPNQNIGQP